MMRILGAAAAALMVMTASAFADPIEGKWKLESGASAQISACGSAYCVKLISGEHNGKAIGKMSANGAEYAGTMTDPADNKTYKGKGWFAGKNTLKLRGYSGIFFKTQTWTRM